MTANNTQRVATNATYLLVSQLLTWGLSLATAVALPRYFGAAGTGSYHLASALWATTALLIGFGTDVVISREIARRPGRTSALVGAGLLQRVAFYVAGYAILAVFANLAGYAAETVQLVYIFGAANLFYQIGHIFSAAHYGLERMGPLSFVAVVTELIGTIGMLVLILARQSLATIAAVSVLAGGVRMVLLYWTLRRIHPLRIRWEVALVPWLVRESVSILGNRLVRNAYVQADVIIISLFVNETVVGWYSVADAAYGSLLFVANIIGSAVFPTLARLHETDVEEFTAVARRAFRWVLLASVPLGLGVALVATPLLVLIVGPDFRNAGPVLSLFGIVAIFTSINILLGQQLIAMNRQNRLTLLMGAAVAITLPVDLFLIPWTQANWGNGALGGVIAYLLTESLITLGAFLSLPHYTYDRGTLLYAVRVLVAGGCMVLVVWSLRDAFLLWPILAGVVSYGVAAVLLRLIAAEDVALARVMLRRLWQRLGRRVSAAPEKA